MQEQELMQGKVPQEATPEPKAETPAAEQRQAEKNVGIELGNKHSINVQNKDDQIHITYPNRKDIDYAFTKTTGMNWVSVGYAESSPENKIHERESLQDRTIAFNAKDLTPDTIAKLSSAIEKSRTISQEYALEKANAISLFKDKIKDREIVIYGVPYKKNKKPTPENEKMKWVPSWLQEIF